MNHDDHAVFDNDHVNKYRQESVGKYVYGNRICRSNFNIEQLKFKSMTLMIG
jgi:hypothetical protein